MALALTACGSTGATSGSGSAAISDADTSADASTSAQETETLETTTIYVDAAASLQAVFEEVILPAYKEAQPNVTVVANYGSSGKLLSGIEEANGIDHDIFFSAGKAQVTTLDETDGMVVDGSIVNLLANQLCLVKGNDTETAVTGWDNLSDAKLIALCGGSVPVGKYSRIALISLGVLPESDDPASYTSDEISAALGGVLIDEADDVEAAAVKAVEGAVEVATIYYSDYYNHQNDLTILAQDDGTLTGKIVYPVCQVANPNADEAESAAAANFLAFLQNDLCREAYAEYCFIVND
jgi:molybdate transport system substrate-binding protein